MEKLNVGIFFGSKNPEHDVSIITGQLIISELKKLGYNIIPVYLNKEGDWFINESLGRLKFFHDENKDEKLEKLPQYYLNFSPKKEKMIFKKKGLFSKEIIIDLAFPAFHGLNGEDGTIQGVFELCNVPYVGCDVPSSAIAMDKILTKLFYKSQNIPTTNFMSFSAKDWQEDKNSIIEKIKSELKWPVFVKPARLGSSIGMTKVKKHAELENALEVALHYDQKILVEESVEDVMDITCAVLGNEKPQPSLIQESLFESDHFSYEDKYLKDGGAQLGNAQQNIVIPARLDDEKTKEVQKTAVQIFKQMGCSGIARVDFLYDKAANIIYANEINTLPGTLYHHLWEKTGISLNELISKLLELAKQKHEEKNKITSIFQSDLLSHASSIKLQIKNDDK